MEKETLKYKVVSGVLWKGLERICAQAVSAIVSIILARILVPDDYSIVSIVAIFFSFCNIFISSGLNQSLIQKKDADDLDYSTILVVNMIFAVVLYFMMYIASPYISKLYGKPILTPIIRIMALTFFVNAYKSVLCAKISSELRFKLFFRATFIGTCVSAVAGIAMALGGFGAWSLVAQQMTNSIIDTLMLRVTTDYRFGIRFSYERFQNLFGYGLRITLASILSVLYNECNPLIVGLKFSTTSLAFYNKGMMFPGLINSIGKNTLAPTLFPAMSKIQDDPAALRNATRRFIKVSSFIIFPLMAGLMAVSETFVRVVLTEKWLPIVPFMLVFCISYGFDLIQTGNLQMIQAIGRGDYVLKMEIIKKANYFIVIALFVWKSNSAFELALSSIVCTAIATLVNTYPTKKILGYGLYYQFKDMSINLFCSIVLFFTVRIIGNLPVPDFFLLIIQVFIGIVCYLLLCLILKNEAFFYILNIAKSITADHLQLVDR